MKLRFNSKVAKYLASAVVSTSVLISGSFLVAPNEGQVNQVYLDPVNILTSCYGHTGKELRIGQKFKDEECYKQLSEDLTIAEKAVNEEITFPVSTYQKAALISFTYNVGRKKLAESTMAERFNAGDVVGGCNELMRWVYANKKKLHGLEIRRQEEMLVCLGGKSEVDFIQQQLSTIK